MRVGDARIRLPLLTAGAALAAAAAVAAPSTALLPGPESVAEQLVACIAFAVALAVGYVFPVRAFFGFLVLVVVEGAFRKWVLNDVAVFLLKDFLLFGVYAAVIPSLTREELRRPRWLLAPLAALIALALAHALGSETWQQAVIGLRSYVIYVPLLWVAPKLLAVDAHAIAVTVLVFAIGVAESVLGTLQTLTASEFLNRSTPGVVPGFVTIDGSSIIRPTGTFLHTGTFSSFLLFPILAALAVVGAANDRRLRVAAVVATVFLTWGYVFAASRALTATAGLALVTFVVLAIARRRFLAIAGVATAAAAGVLALVSLPLGSAEFVRNDVVAKRTSDGTIVQQPVSVARAGSNVVSGFAGKGARATASDFTGKELPRNRIRAQLDIIREQGLVGHGTGTLTLGAEYAAPTAQGEGMPTKLAWELGLPGLAAFVLFLLAAAVAALRGALAARGAQRVVALVGLGAAALVPLIGTLTFVLDVPVAAVLYYVFAGYAVAQDAVDRG